MESKTAEMHDVFRASGGRDRKPACVKACPTDTLMFGTRVKNLEVARHRIYSYPDKYVHHIYGEHEVGGTGYIYIVCSSL